MSVFCTEGGHLDFKDFVKCTVIHTECFFLQGNAGLKSVTPEDFILGVRCSCLAGHSCSTTEDQWKYYIYILKSVVYHTLGSVKVSFALKLK